MKKEPVDSIQNKVYDYRVLARMTQQELADQVGVSKQTIFVMEKGNYVPSLLLAFRIANYFGAEISEIFTYEIGGNEDEN
ncbi:MAG TPA: helix-turn-helix transcriptional regulator [Flavobacterium sp.]|nr:helix-turn-helix transcriptional regulator [Flavobacterium sp.]